MAKKSIGREKKQNETVKRDQMHDIEPPHVMKRPGGLRK